MGQVVLARNLAMLRPQWTDSKKRVVFTNGCFDIIHRGHVEYLAKAKTLGDVLVVGVNTDRSVHRIKGDKRPIVSEEDRAFVVAGLSSVDYVCLFDEDTPLNLIRAIVPDVLVKGADWNVQDVVGKDVVEKNGGRVATIEVVPNKSTTGIIQAILERFR